MIRLRRTPAATVSVLNAEGLGRVARGDRDGAVGRRLRDDDG
ncbi:MAG: hypothetical protein WB611_08705 [Stellaceae bacterium]